MAGIEVVPGRNRAANEGGWLEWHINRNLKAGAQFEAMGHRVTVERIVESFPEYNVALVSVGGSVATAPPLRFEGRFDSETRLADDAWRGPRQR